MNMNQIKILFLITGYKPQASFKMYERENDNLNVKLYNVRFNIKENADFYISTQN